MNNFYIYTLEMQSLGWAGHPARYANALTYPMSKYSWGPAFLMGNGPLCTRRIPRLKIGNGPLCTRQIPRLEIRPEV